MGKNTYFRKYYTDWQIDQLLLKIDGYKSLFDNRKFNSELEWRANISRHLDQDSCNRFYFKLESQKETRHCHFCRTKLGIESFWYVGYKKGFAKYCPTCKQKEIWKHSESYLPEKLKERGKKITSSKLNFYQTERGKNTAYNNGIKISKSLKHFFSTDAGHDARKKSSELNSKIMRSKILTGEFTPNSNNRNTHWESSYNGKRYRSSWEALYQYHNPEAEYEQLRIEYEYKEKSHIYIVDFINHSKKIVTEVKPKELTDDPKTKAKIDALEKWSKANNYSFVIFGVENIIELDEPDYSKFDCKTQEKIKAIYAKIKN